MTDRAAKRLRIVHVIAPSAVGGAESVVHAMANGQRRRGHSVAVIALLNRGAEDPWLVRSLREADVPTIAVRSPSRAYWREVKIIRRTLQEHRPQVLHCHGYRGIVLGFLAARGTDCRLVATAHGYTGGDWKNHFYEWLDRRTLRGFDAVIAVSGQLERLLIAAGVPKEVLQVAPNGVAPLVLRPREEARRTLKVPPNATTLGWIGRLSVEKGPDVFLTAFSALAAPNIYAVLIGDGRERSALEALASRLRISERVRFAGQIPDAARLLEAFDMVVLSSRREGLPIVLLEAMTAGVPVVATAVGEIPHVTRGNELARLVDADHPTDLAAEIDSVLANPSDTERRAQLARQAVKERFGVDVWLDRIHDVYLSAWSTSRSRPSKVGGLSPPSDSGTPE